MSEDLCYQSIGELAAQLESKQISPVELTRAYLERIRELDGKLNSYITVTEDVAIRQARRAEAEILAGRYRGPLHGIPYAAKDLVAGTNREHDLQNGPDTWFTDACGIKKGCRGKKPVS